jgi:hypothetical protein
MKLLSYQHVINGLLDVFFFSFHKELPLKNHVHQQKRNHQRSKLPFIFSLQKYYLLTNKRLIMRLLQISFFILKIN